MNIFFCADLHLDHYKIIESCNRPFSSTREMSESLLENFNSTISDKDIVWAIGDSFWKEESAIFWLKNVKGNWNFILGNHDKDLRSWIKKANNSKVSSVIHEYADIKIEDQKITLCHYPMVSWNCSHYGSWLLYGHVHGGRIPLKGKMYDVGVDNNNYNPVSFETIKGIMDKLPQNWNYLGDKNVENN